MDPKDAKELARLLVIAKEEGGWLPEEAFRPYHGLASIAAVELLIPHPHNKKAFLLTHRSDEDFVGWHLPGGYIRTTDRSLDDACRRVFSRELVGEHCVGTSFLIQEITLIDGEKWIDHPYGAPVSLLMKCQITGSLETNDSTKFFRAVPDDFIQRGPQAALIQNYLNSLGQ